MLELKNITKKYCIGDYVQYALKDVNINFRKCEFVSVLGPSGSGKTTLLNIIGGLDRYDEGNLIINGVSTKKYKDKDWDSYRNHNVGFVFQNYNLIYHQTVLSNVELALTLAGINKKERKKRAIEVLDKVGLKKHINKKPNQLSGGQMQRVAIARALVNNPDILLADEPTGALDSETSLQIMDLLKEISKTKLVIMVTHNPILAKDYSTRIIDIKDGQIVNDSNPYDHVKTILSNKKIKNTNMSFLTSLSLSLNNLMTKKGRTILTAFAGSIGIIGIALILSLSNGVNTYIKKTQEDTLTSYPLTIEKKSIDAQDALSSFMSNKDNNNPDKDAIYSNDIMYNMMSSFNNKISTNNLKDFKKYLETHDEIKNYSNDIKYGYNIDLQVYTKDYIKVNPTDILSEFYKTDSAVYTDNMRVFNELSENQKLIESQYDLLEGSYATSKDEIVLIVDKNNEINDYVLYSLGLKDQKELQQIMNLMKSGKKIKKVKQTKYNYDDILNKEFKLVINSDYYSYENGVWVDRSSDYSYLNNLVDKSLTIKIVGIIRQKEDSNISVVNGIGYTKELQDYVINSINESDIAREQLDNKSIDVFTNKKFSGMNTYETNLEKIGIVSLDDPDVINIYPTDFKSKEKIEKYIKDYNKGKKESDKIEYTDYVGLLMNSVTTIVDVIGIVLIAFVSISLIVSSIMIGIITYISVLERTKEIGILRSIGAKKKDISRVFNAETFIIGISAGGLGIAITLLLNICINSIIKNLTNIYVKSALPLSGAIILIIISTLLTLVAGLIPSRIASRKDPVVALRTE